MAMRTFTCPSCGAVITLDDSKETGHCSFCGEKLDIGPQLTVAAPSPEDDAPNTRMRLWGFFLLILGIAGLLGNIGLGITQTVLCICFVVGGAVLVGYYYWKFKKYADAVKKHYQNNLADYSKDHNKEE